MQLFFSTCFILFAPLTADSTRHKLVTCTHFYDPTISVRKPSVTLRAYSSTKVDQHISCVRHWVTRETQRRTKVHQLRTSLGFEIPSDAPQVKSGGTQHPGRS